MSRRPTVRVWEVAFHSDTSPGTGGDGFHSRRFATREAAERFRADLIREGYSGPWGHGEPDLRSDDVPRDLARRWGVA